MPKTGKRPICSGLEEGQGRGVTFHEDTANAAQVIDECYVMEERPPSATGFVPTPRSTTSLLETLGRYARIFSMRDADGNILCWDFCLAEGIRAQAEYGASTEAGRRLRQPRSWTSWPQNSPPATAREFDLMGAHCRAAPTSTASESTRAPLPHTSQTCPAAGMLTAAGPP